jgi:hypothetical protein
MSACTAYRELLLDVLYDEAAEPDRAGFEVHCAACEECRAELERLTTVSRELKAWPAVAAPRLARAWPPRRSRASFWSSPRLAWGVAALALVAGVALRADLRFDGGVARISLALPGTEIAPAALTPEQIAAAVQSAIAVSEERQRRELALVLSSMVDQIEGDLAQQLYAVHRDLDRLENTTFQVVNASQTWSAQP